MAPCCRLSSTCTSSGSNIVRPHSDVTLGDFGPPLLPLRGRSLFDASGDHTCPDGSIIRPVRSPQNWFFTCKHNLRPGGHRPLHHLFHVLDIDEITTGELPSGCGARLARVGHSASMMTIAPLIVSSAWATIPSGPGRRPSSTAPNAVLQKSIAAPTSRPDQHGHHG